MTPERREIMDVFLRDAGWGAANVAPLSGDASTRRYARLMLNDRSAMLMDQPQNAEAPQCPPGATPEQRRVLGYNAIARLAGGDCRRFIATAEFLRSKGLSAPRIYAADIANGFVLIEDLGDDLYATVLAGDGAAMGLGWQGREARCTLMMKRRCSPRQTSSPNGSFLSLSDGQCQKMNVLSFAHCGAIPCNRRWHRPACSSIAIIMRRIYFGFPNAREQHAWA